MNRRQFFTTLAAATFAGVAGGGMSDALLMRGATAPGGAGHDWVKRQKVTGGDWGYPAVAAIITYKNKCDRYFISNPHLDYAEVRTKVESMGGHCCVIYDDVNE